MKTELKARLERAIETCIEDCCEEELWSEYIHDNLYKQMASAAALVFDAAQEAQKFAKEQ